MMASALSATSAVLLVVPTAGAQAEAPPATSSERRPTQRQLYAPYPTRPESGISGAFFASYGSNLPPLALRRGAKLGPLATAPPAPPVADTRAGVGETTSRRGLVLLAAVLVALGLGAFLVAPTAARAAVPDGFVGITTEDAYTGATTYARKQFVLQKRAGITIARQVFRWNEIEPKNGHYDFSATDRFVINAARSNIRILPLLQGEPEWASSRPAGNTSRALYPPKDPAVFGRFGAKLAQRYGPGGELWAQHPTVPKVPITSYQLWNEPNFPVYWKDKPNAAEYARLLIAGAAGIRSVQPDAYIVSAGIPDSAIGQAPQPFVRRMLAAGAGRAVSAIGIHPYAIDVKGVMALTRGMRRTLDRAPGGKEIDLWVTEIGWAAGGPKTKKRTVTYRRQGPMIRDAFRQLAAARQTLRLRGVVYFAWRDSEVYAGGRDFWGLHTGLHDRQGKAKPAMKVVSKALSGLQ